MQGFAEDQYPSAGDLALRNPWRSQPVAPVPGGLGGTPCSSGGGE